MYLPDLPCLDFLKFMFFIWAGWSFFSDGFTHMHVPEVQDVRPNLFADSMRKSKPATWLQVCPNLNIYVKISQ